ncbi:MAG: excinuclease ABC subunit UvrA [Deltaproteobacteria bacterium]|uniref:UvrABC system protein A n=1 Tax=Candidatus Zymogenus saltonus TaxID=2844893 RepID=A0A9D8KHU6_9DELT|nr:excinuclease ABC subunit UvrA [Candidatus Zymogenus saltonus]
MAETHIRVKGAREHNLKDIEIVIPRDKLVVITGLSGSGKSTLAFDTIYAEGQRRYVESLSAYARQFLEQMDKPDVDVIEGLSPAISIEQKTTSKNPRSTVGTVTEIYDYLRLLFARIGRPFCYSCGKEISSVTVQSIVDHILELPNGTKFSILAPIIKGRKGEYKKELDGLRRSGYLRVRIDGSLYSLDEKIELDKNKKHDIDVVVDRLIIKEGVKSRLTDSIETALKLSDGFVTIAPEDSEDIPFSEKFACNKCGISYPELTPRLFSFNNPHGACPECGGLGTTMYLDPDLIVPNKSLSVREGAVVPWEKKNSVYHFQMLDALAKHYSFDIYTPFEELSNKVKNVILYGSGNENIDFYFERDGRKFFYPRPFEGIIENLNRRYHDTDSEMIREEIARFMNVRSCAACNGARLRVESLNIKIDGKNISEYTGMSIRELLELVRELKFSPQEELIAGRVIKEIVERLGFLTNVGLDYLTLARTAATLSGGEGQRIRLATQIGSGLVGVLYILDEPSIGLHQKDNRKLLNTLTNLRDLGNSVLVVEHDEETIRSADFIIDMGPGAGISGGEIVFNGTPEEILLDEKSITGKYLSGRLTIPIPEERKGARDYLHLVGARENNLKSIDVKFPLGVFTCVTGVSGSGKSSLVIDTLFKALSQTLYRSKEQAGKHDRIEGSEKIDKVIDIDQSPIGRTPRSNPATYTGLFTHIRDLFAQLPESRMRGYKPGRYSFNVKGGRCETCQGDGIIKIEMHFLPDVYVTCEVCGGKRYNRETLEISYKGKNISDVLNMTVNQSMEFFVNHPQIMSKLSTLSSVGLGYIRLGQPATTLSGGEAQRIKLSKELSKRSTGKTLYILDEPTTGLHFADIKNLLKVLFRLRDEGNTIIVIEHNPDMIKSADYIIDLGPEGGDRGGEIVAEGTPEELAKMEGTYTGELLDEIFKRESEKKVKAEGDEDDEDGRGAVAD